MAKEAKKTIFDIIKEQLEKKGGESSGKKFYTREGDEKRVRFLTDMEDYIMVKFHESPYTTDKKAKKVKYPCLSYYGKKCPGCSDDSLNEVTYYIYQLYNYDMKGKQFMIEKVNKCSPIPYMGKMAERRGTITDRDYVIIQMGSETGKTYTLDPQDPKPFKKKDCEPWTEEEILEIIKDDMYLNTLNSKDDDEEEEEVKPKKKKKVVEEEEEEEVKPKKKKKVVVEDDFDDEDDD